MPKNVFGSANPGPPIIACNKKKPTYLHLARTYPAGRWSWGFSRRPGSSAPRRMWGSPAKEKDMESWYWIAQLAGNLSIEPYHPFEVADLHVQNVHGDGIAEPLQLLVQLGVLIIELVLDVLVDEVDWKEDASGDMVTICVVVVSFPQLCFMPSQAYLESRNSWWPGRCCPPPLVHA